jgi:hypothetical protein
MAFFSRILSYLKMTKLFLADFFFLNLLPTMEVKRKHGYSLSCLKTLNKGLLRV